MLYKEVMSSQNRSEALNEALRFLVVSDMPAEYKRTLIDVVTQALRDDEVAHRQREAVQKADAAEWQPHEVSKLETFLQGKIARSWQHADEILMRIATELHRQPANVRSKATELGFGAGVDYRVAKAAAALPSS